MASLAKKGVFDHLIIESTGISEPMAVAETFTYELSDSTDATTPSKVIELIDGEEGELEARVGNPLQSLMDIAEIDSMVTVVDAANFLNDLEEAEELAARFWNNVTCFKDKNWNCIT